MVIGVNQVKYLEIWARVLTNDNLKKECSDVMHIIELNAKLERMSSRMKN